MAMPLLVIVLCCIPGSRVFVLQHCQCRFPGGSKSRCVSCMQACLLQGNILTRSSLLTVANNVLQDCLPVVTLLFRIQGKELVDLLYAATSKAVRGCKLLQVAMMALQLMLVEVSAVPTQVCIADHL